MLRRSFTWVVPGAVVAVVVFAALDALRSFGGEPTASAPSATEAVTTMQTETGAEIESSAQLQSGQLVRLIPGRVTTDERRWYFVTFTVPPGWYGHERADTPTATTASFAIGKELSEEAADLSSGGISVRSGGISVHVLDLSVARASRRLEKQPGLRIFDVSPVRIGGHAGRRYSLAPLSDGALSHALGIPGLVRLYEPEMILLDVPNVTLLIRRGFDSDQERTEIERVLSSFEFPRSVPPEQTVERIANKWAPLFARGMCAHGALNQPLCEQINGCVGPDGSKIPNCTPLSSEFRKSFGGATVEVVAIKGDRAGVMFSNGAVIELSRSHGSWGVNKVGGNAGREFFK
jgi:hypothetical protein